MNYQYLYKYILPVVIILASFVLGLIIEKFLLQKIKNKSKKIDIDSLIDSLKGYLTLVLVLFGTKISSMHLSLSKENLNLSEKIIDNLVIFVIAIFVSKYLKILIRNHTVRISKVFPASSILEYIIRTTIIAIATIIILKNFNISIAPILTALGVGGLAVALALQPTLSNLFSGIQLIASKQLKPGDYIKLDSGQEGYVTDVTWRYTSIKALANNTYMIPNAKISDSVITNYYKPEKEMSVLAQVGVSYDSDLEKVEKVTIEVAKSIIKNFDHSPKEFKPFIRFHTFNDFSIDFTVILRVKEFVDQYIVKHEFVKALHKRFKEEGIEIPFPIRTIIEKK
jgi:small-conductance mechanosensitive channel